MREEGNPSAREADINITKELPVLPEHARTAAPVGIMKESSFRLRSVLEPRAIENSAISGHATGTVFRDE